MSSLSGMAMMVISSKLVWKLDSSLLAQRRSQQHSQAHSYSVHWSWIMPAWPSPVELACCSDDANRKAAVVHCRLQHICAHERELVLFLQPWNSPISLLHESFQLQRAQGACC